MTSNIHPLNILNRIIQEYREHLLTEFRAKDPELKKSLQDAIDKPGFLAGEPFFQAHRPFQEGKKWRDLPIDKRLAAVMEQKSPRAYQHQSEAIAHLLGDTPTPLVVTTGTGSGKTETFLLPVIQNAIAANQQTGLTAILIYPMNALANDQLSRINSYLEASGWAGAVTVAKYDRGTTQKQRQELRKNPPHILLTNYMMLEYLLIRPADRDSLFANHRCRYLVLDEVHTYRGALGANIALLVRRLQGHLARVANRQDAPPTPTLIPIGTSATIKSDDEEGNPGERDRAIKQFFHKISGATVDAIKVIGEELADRPVPPQAVYSQKPAAPGPIDIGDISSFSRAINALADQPPTTPLAEAVPRARILWEIDRWLTRSPLSISQIVEKLKNQEHRAEYPPQEIETEVTAALVAGAALPNNIEGGLKLRAHQFIRGGWQFYRCLNPNCGQLYPMGEERCSCGYATAPLYLCRNCGAHYLRFTNDNPTDPAAQPLTPNSDIAADSEWMLYEPARFENTVNEEEEEEEPKETPKSKTGKNRKGKQTQQMRRRPVCRGYFNPRTRTFSFDPAADSIPVALAPARTRCLCCGGTAGSRSVVTPVALGTSAAVKVLAEALVEALAASHQNQEKQRLLIFSDSRQDAAHQARFIEFASRYDRLRRRLVELLEKEGELTLQRTIELLGERGVKNRDNPHLPEKLSRRIPQATLNKIRAWEEAPLLDEIAITAGYRATVINLGLVEINYENLTEDIAENGGELAKSLDLNLTQLTYLCLCLLNEMRVRGCLSRSLLCYHPDSPSYPEALKAANWERRVKNPGGYALQDGQPAGYLDKAELPYGIQSFNPWRKPKAGGRAPSLERIIKQLLEGFGKSPNLLVNQLLEVLEFLLEGGFLVESQLFGYRESAELLQVNSEIVYLNLIADGERFRCEICNAPAPGNYPNFPCPQCHGKLIKWSDLEVAENRYFQRIKKQAIIPLNAREHTAQVPNSDRVEIEEAFKSELTESAINLLACSPTLEMGIDVGGLDAVLLRNIPPRPDNYAQRGGRAGRKTRVGLVLGYARNTPHDQYFYDKPGEMIAGAVPAPAIALGNRDAIFRHLSAIAFGAAEPGLSGKMLDYVSPQGEIQEETTSALIAAVAAKTDEAVELALEVWGEEILTEADLNEDRLRQHLAGLGDRIRDLINRTARQVIELRQNLDFYSQQLKNKSKAMRSGDLISNILGIPQGKRNSNTDIGDSSAGYPPRRFAEFGILPGYEFPTQPATLRLLGDKSEAQPIATGRRVGINQFRPNAQVYARVKRWKVVGIDNASPWNPESSEPGWLYRLCNRCELRYHADHPRCPRCQNDTPGRNYPAAELAGFIAKADEKPVLEEEERYAARNLVTVHPQWDGDIIGRWQVGPGWTLHLCREEEVRWINEGFPPSKKELETNAPMLHSQGNGYPVCLACGRLLNLEAVGSGGRRRATKQDPFGHTDTCPQRGKEPQPLAIATSEKSEVLRLLVPVPKEMKTEAVQEWGLSLGYSLKIGMEHRYMLDSSEIEFEFEGVWEVQHDQKRYYQACLTFIDPSLGGSGYWERIAAEFDRVAARAIAHLDHGNCETACYRCLKSYQNQRYHDRLNWTIGMAALSDLQEFRPQKQQQRLRDVSDPQPWLDAYKAGVGSPLELRFLQLFEEEGLKVEKQVAIAPQEGQQPITVADFALPAKRIAIYIDSAAFHRGPNLRRDKLVRDKLRQASPPWRVVELTSADLSHPPELIFS